MFSYVFVQFTDLREVKQTFRDIFGSLEVGMAKDLSEKYELELQDTKIGRESQVDAFYGVFGLPGRFPSAFLRLKASKSHSTGMSSAL